jgi:hypothetical protein
MIFWDMYPCPKCHSENTQIQDRAHCNLVSLVCIECFYEWDEELKPPEKSPEKLTKAERELRIWNSKDM